MNEKVLIIIGVFLTVICGSSIGRKLGTDAVNQVILAGFAAGVALLGQARAAALSRRIVDLEAKVEKLENNLID